MSDFTNHAENKLIDALFRGQALGAPATWDVLLKELATGDLVLRAAQCRR